MKKIAICLFLLVIFESSVFANVETYQVFDKNVRKDTSWYIDNGIVYKTGVPIELTIKNENSFCFNFNYDESFMGDIYNKGFNTVRVSVPVGFSKEKLIDFIDLAAEYDINVILVPSSDYTKEDIRSVSRFTIPFPNIVGIETNQESSEIAELILNTNPEILIILKNHNLQSNKLPPQKVLIIQPIMELIHKWRSYGRR